jgi:hypothetical protein
MVLGLYIPFQILPQHLVRASNIHRIISTVPLRKIFVCTSAVSSDEENLVLISLLKFINGMLMFDFSSVVARVLACPLNAKITILIVSNSEACANLHITSTFGTIPPYFHSRFVRIHLSLLLLTPCCVDNKYLLNLTWYYFSCIYE